MDITDPLLTSNEVVKFLRISRPTFYRRIADGTMPQPVKIGSLSRWPKSEIERSIENAKAARSNVPCAA